MNFDAESNDTIMFDKGNVVIKKIVPKPAKKEKDSISKPGFFKRLFTKKDSINTAQKVKKQRAKNSQPVKKTSKPAQTKKATTAKPMTAGKKPGFFQRLFSKKEKSNGQGA